LIFHDVGAAVPSRVDDDLSFGKVRDRIESDVLDRPQPAQRRHPNEQEHDELVVRAGFDNLVDHCFDSTSSITCESLITEPPLLEAKALASSWRANAKTLGMQRSKTIS
jgi:hypothetical protein